MTVIDAHTHMNGRSFSGIAGFQPKRFLELMDNAKIDQAWVFTLDGLYFDPSLHNDALIEFCASEPSRLIPFCTVHPRYPNAIEELRRCILDLGMKGVKLHPWAQAFSTLDPFMDPLGDELERLGVPVVFHDGTPPNSSPLQIAYFAMRHPKIPVILGHAGLHDLWKEAIYAAERCPNIYLIPSGMPPFGIEHAIKRLPIERFLFGTDAGFGEPYWQLFQLEKIRQLNLDSQAEALILGGNAERILSQSVEIRGR
jgi:uncharacterized protein